MLRYLLLLPLLLYFTGCESGERGKAGDGSMSYGTFRRVEFEGHTYIVYSEGVLQSRVGGITHDPDCAACQQVPKVGTTPISLQHHEDRCDECGEFASTVTRDASGVRHCFCSKHWDAHVKFTGNLGKPYGW